MTEPKIINDHTASQLGDIRYCVVCGVGSHRSDWKKLKPEEVHCDDCVLPPKPPTAVATPPKPVLVPTWYEKLKQRAVPTK